MSDIVWISCALKDTTLYKGLDADIAVDIPLIDLQEAGKICGRHTRGETLHPDEFPKELYGKFKQRKVKRLPDIFFGNGFWCVSVATADVLRKFDLGIGGLVPIKVFQHDRTTPVEGEYFCLNFGAYKSAFLPEHSVGVRPAGGAHMVEDTDHHSGQRCCSFSFGA